MSATNLTLFVTRAGFGLPDVSPFVLKTEVQLQMAGLAYERVSAVPPQAPKGKLPYIDDHGAVVSDSTFIRAHIERTYGLDLDAGLDAPQRAQAWAIERLLEDHLYFAMVWFRWIDPDNFARGPAQFANDAPEAERAAVRQAASGPICTPRASVATRLRRSPNWAGARSTPWHIGWTVAATSWGTR